MAQSHCNCSLKCTNIISLGNTGIKTMTSYFNELYHDTQLLSLPQRALLRNSGVRFEAREHWREQNLHSCPW